MDFTLPNPTVLCVDPDPEARDLLPTLLPDFRLFFAATAFEALRELNARGYCGYLIDYWLPDWSGPALCREIRKIDPHAPIVFSSSAVRDQDRARALRAGANVYLCKPLDPLELRAKVKAFLTRAEIESVRAKIEEERAVQEELERRFQDAMQRVGYARQLEAASVERTARSRAYKAFIGARGTRAHFESWWPQVFSSASANRPVDGV